MKSIFGALLLLGAALVGWDALQVFRAAEALQSNGLDLFGAATELRDESLFRLGFAGLMCVLGGFFCSRDPATRAEEPRGREWSMRRG
jgi:hypothetical protein